MKNYSKCDIVKVVNDLITKNGSTTNLDVKNELRNQGFWAVQSDVAKMTNELHESENWEFSFNGTYRIYSKNNNVNLDDDITTFSLLSSFDDNDDKNDGTISPFVLRG